jgi:uncharacterized protein YjiS (DUF1127 family)
MVMSRIINIRWLNRSSEGKDAAPEIAGNRQDVRAMTRLLSVTTARSAGPLGVFAPVRPVWNLAKSLVQRLQNRRAVLALLDWDDRALRDIGLTRADVRLALGLPFMEDPSARLQAWALERRAARLTEWRRGDSCFPGPHLRLVSGRIRSTKASISR